MVIRRGIHLETDLPAIHQGLVAEECPVKILAVQRGALNEMLLRAVVLRGNGKRLAIRQV